VSLLKPQTAAKHGLADHHAADEFFRQSAPPWLAADGRLSALAVANDAHHASDIGFVSLQNAYRASGGLANGNELAARLHVNGEGGFATLARWIVSQQVFSFAWNNDFWLPMFQFDVRDLSPRRGLRPVLAELADVMDGWAMAAWFAQPNDALNGRSPASLWLSDWPEVFQAARLQRFVIKG
jgi:hypothetical protein